MSARPGWTGSRIVPGDWNTRKRKVIARAEGHCQSCGAAGPLEVDHIVNVAEGGSHSLDNLQALCRPCHAEKTRAEQQRGRDRRKALLRRRPEPHPGLISPDA